MSFIQLRQVGRGQTLGECECDGRFWKIHPPGNYHIIYPFVRYSWRWWFSSFPQVRYGFVPWRVYFVDGVFAFFSECPQKTYSKSFCLWLTRKSYPPHEWFEASLESRNTYRVGPTTYCKTTYSWSMVCIHRTARERYSVFDMSDYRWGLHDGCHCSRRRPLQVTHQNIKNESAWKLEVLMIGEDG